MALHLAEMTVRRRVEASVGCNGALGPRFIALAAARIVELDAAPASCRGGAAHGDRRDADAGRIALDGSRAQAAAAQGERGGVAHGSGASARASTLPMSAEERAALGRRTQERETTMDGSGMTSMVCTVAATLRCETVTDGAHSRVAYARGTGGAGSPMGGWTQSAGVEPKPAAEQRRCSSSPRACRDASVPRLARIGYPVETMWRQP